MPTQLRELTARATEPKAVVEAFLDAAAGRRVDEAVSYLADDVTYVNVGLPAVHGARDVERVLRFLERPGVAFEVYHHSIAADGPVVLTERTDVLCLGPVRSQFWVAGRFDVHDGRITLWRDAFDYLDVARGTLRGALGAVIPGLRPSAPLDPSSTAPGR